MRRLPGAAAARWRAREDNDPPGCAVQGMAVAEHGLLVADRTFQPDVLVANDPRAAHTVGEAPVRHRHDDRVA